MCTGALNLDCFRNRRKFQSFFVAFLFSICLFSANFVFISSLIIIIIIITIIIIIIIIIIIMLLLLLLKRGD